MLSRNEIFSFYINFLILHVWKNNLCTLFYVHHKCNNSFQPFQPVFSHTNKWFSSIRVGGSNDIVNAVEIWSYNSALRLEKKSPLTILNCHWLSHDIVPLMWCRSWHFDWILLVFSHVLKAMRSSVTRINLTKKIITKVKRRDLHHDDKVTQKNIKDITWPRGDTIFIFQCCKYLSLLSEAN